jgi:glycosyltransferase involved in cell wall biosynthesis
MRIVYLSYAHITNYSDPLVWLEQLDFYTSQLESLSKYADVKSVHLINYNGKLVKNEVEYHFLNVKSHQLKIPISINKYVLGLQPDVLFVHGLVFPWQVLWLGFQASGSIPVFVVHHAEKPFLFPRNMLTKIADRFVKGYFFASMELGKMWVESHQIKSSLKIHEVMEVTSRFSLTNNDWGPRSINYLWVGRLDENKDPITLVKAFLLFLRSCPEAILYIIYRGNTLQKEVESILRGNPNSKNIFLKEDIAHNDLESWYNKSEFIISTSHYEGSGTAVCEAMSCACIPILSNIPSFRMMSDQGSVGILFEKDSVEGLHWALIKSLEIDKAQEYQKVLKQFNEQLSAEAIAKRTMEIISPLIQKKI